MKKVKITPIRRTVYTDLMEKYENPIENHCDITMNREYISENGKIPEGFCNAAWESIEKYVYTLAHGGENFFDGWMKNPRSALLSCNDGFRPVSFLIETIED